MNDNYNRPNIIQQQNFQHSKQKTVIFNNNSILILIIIPVTINKNEEFE